MLTRRDVEQLIKQFEMPLDREPDFREKLMILAAAARREGVKIPPWMQGVLDAIRAEKRGEVSSRGGRK